MNVNFIVVILVTLTFALSVLGMSVSNPNVMAWPLRDRELIGLNADNITRSGVQIYQGTGQAAPFAIVQELHGLPCDGNWHRDLLVQEWWDDYFKEVTINRTKYADLYTLVKKGEMNQEIYKREMGDVCLFGYRLLNCLPGNPTAVIRIDRECQCRTPQTRPEPTNPDPNALSTRTHMECLINRDQNCARATRPGDYATYKRTRRRCVPGDCCKYDPATGLSQCKQCTGGTSTETEIQIQPLTFLFLAFIFYNSAY